jgi:hypothetical protein
MGIAVTIASAAVPVNVRGVGQDARMPDLPVHSGADARLADAFSKSGCPLCRVRADRERTYMASILSEFVNDVPFRAQLDRARGFCGAHVHALVDADRRGSGGLLGPAILFHAVMRIRLREAAETHKTKGRSRSKRVAEARTPALCPICAEIRRADAVTVAGLVHMAADPAWAQAAASAAFCLDHLLAMMGEAPSNDAWSQVEAHQLARLRQLEKTVESFVQRSSHDRRHLITDEERASLAATAISLGGDSRRSERG